jgi:hypothetical protein
VAAASDTPGSRIVNALGALVVNASAMEESLHDAIWVLSGGNNVAIGVLTAGLSFRYLVDKFGALCTELKTCRLPREDVAKYCAHLHALNDERNLMIHSAWNWAGSAGTRRYKRTAKVKSGFSFNMTPINADAVRELADKYVEAEKNLWEYVP